MKTFRAYFRMLRIRDWIKFYTLFPLLGAILAGGSALQVGLIGTIYLCIIGYGFVINNYFDVEIDRRHDGKLAGGTNPLASDEVTRRGTLLFSVALVAMALLLAVTTTITGLLFCGLSIAALTLYSARPFRLKDRLALDIISHGIMFGGFPFLAGYFCVRSASLFISTLPLQVAVLCTIVCAEALIAHQVNDYWEDLGTAFTTVLRIGRKSGWALLLFTMFLSLLDLVLISHVMAIPVEFFVAALVFLLAYPVHSCRTEIVRETRRTCDRMLVSVMQFQR
jgi:4-hydroxybenzoate polyprenyltransferase